MSDGHKQSTALDRGGAGPSSEELCSYIAEMCGELRSLSRLPTFRTINYLLDMARLEAERTAKELRSRGAGPRSAGDQ